MAIGFFLLMVFGKNGIIGIVLLNIAGDTPIFSESGLVIASFFSGFPFVLKSIQGGLQDVPASLKEVAYSLGKSEMNTYITIVLPLIKRSIISGLLLGLGRSTGEVGISLMLGGNIPGRTETISLSIYNSVFEGNFKKAFVLSLFLSAITFMLFIFMRMISSTTSSYKKNF